MLCQAGAARSGQEQAGAGRSGEERAGAGRSGRRESASGRRWRLDLKNILALDVAVHDAWTDGGQSRGGLAIYTYYIISYYIMLYYSMSFDVMLCYVIS